jgi:hypothetical protein
MKTIAGFIDAVEKLAFEMPVPNPYTPRFIQMCVEARQAFGSTKSEEEINEAALSLLRLVPSG